MPNYYEFVQSMSPGSAGFGLEGGNATLQMDVLADDLTDAITDLLGSCQRRGDGRLLRTLPRAHPQFPWLFANSISNIQGVGQSSKTESESIYEGNPLDYYAEYTRYRLTVTFQPRTYAVLPDEAITVSSLSYYTLGGVIASADYAPEWARFTTIEANPKPEAITAQYGQMVFACSDSDPPNTNTFHGQPRMIVNNAEVSYTWHAVPVSYLDSANSYLDSISGYINQTTWDGWPAGSLLYLGCQAKRYTPPVPQIALVDDTATFSADRLMDVRLMFSYTKRTGSRLPTSANASHVIGGHNLMPWLGDRSQFFYVQSTANEPAYPSVPFQLLFTDPDA